MAPRWATRLCLVALAIGVLIVGVGPILLYALAQASLDAGDPPEQASEVIMAWLRRIWWLVPVATGLIFFGGIGLIFSWVTRLPQELSTDKKPSS